MRHAPALLAALLATTLALAGSAAGQEATTEDVTRWIQLLADPDYQVRREVTERLVEAGEVSRTPLERAAQDPDPERAFRAQHALQRLDEPFPDDWGFWGETDRPIVIRTPPVVVRVEPEPPRTIQAGPRKVAVPDGYSAMTMPEQNGQHCLILSSGRRSYTLHFDADGNHVPPLEGKTRDGTEWRHDSVASLKAADPILFRRVFGELGKIYAVAGLVDPDDEFMAVVARLREVQQLPAGARQGPRSGEDEGEDR